MGLRATKVEITQAGLPVPSLPGRSNAADERDELRAENETLQALARNRELAIGERVEEREALRAENERLRETIAEWQAIHGTFTGDVHVACQAENERLRAIAEAARAFVEQHQIGQPGVPGTLYPMTYGVQDQWHEEWDHRLAALIAACQS